MSTETEPLTDHEPSSLTNAPVSTSDEKRSSKKRGFPSTLARIVPITSLAAPSPTIARTSSSSAPSLRGVNSILRNGHRAEVSRALSSAETPGSGSGRLVASSNRGASCASAARSSVRRSDVGSPTTKTTEPVPDVAPRSASSSANSSLFRPTGRSFRR